MKQEVQNSTRKSWGYYRDVELHRKVVRSGIRRNKGKSLLQWNSIHPRVLNSPRNINLVRNEGMKTALPINPTKKFLWPYTDDKIIDHLVRQTYLYAQQYIERNNLRPYALLKQCKPSDNTEMPTFWAMLIMMGIIHKPAINMIWSKDTLFSTPTFGQLIERDSFLLVLRFPHFADNNNYIENDPDRENVGNITNLIRRCCNVYYFGKKLSIDEILILSKEDSASNSTSKVRRLHLG